jgi:hypothetical protein
MELGLVGHGVNQLPLSQREVRFAKYLPGRHGSLTPPAAAPQSAATPVELIPTRENAAHQIFKKFLRNTQPVSSAPLVERAQRGDRSRS